MGSPLVSQIDNCPGKHLHGLNVNKPCECTAVATLFQACHAATNLTRLQDEPIRVGWHHSNCITATSRSCYRGLHQHTTMTPRTHLGSTTRPHFDTSICTSTATGGVGMPLLPCPSARHRSTVAIPRAASVTRARRRSSREAASAVSSASIVGHSRLTWRERHAWATRYRADAFECISSSKPCPIGGSVSQTCVSWCCTCTVCVFTFQIEEC